MKHNKDLLIQIGSKIRALRDFKGLSQENIAHDLGITQKTYSNIENGNTDITISTLYNLSKILGFSIKDILELGIEKFIQNVFNNNDGNNGVNIMNQYADNSEKIIKLYDKLIDEQREKFEIEIKFLKSQIT